MENVQAKLFQLKWVAIVVVFWVALGVYMRTLTPTVPFWDSGEFIATSYILGIPHPPGTPLYVMIGRLFSLIPIATVAVRINFLSALMSATCVAFMFVVTWKLLIHSIGRVPTQRDKLLIAAGAATAAFFVAFSDSFWDNAIEAEVYSAACLVQALAVWMALRWSDGVKQGKGDNLLLAIVYLLALGGMGIHLGGVLVAPGIVLFALLIKPRAIFNARFLSLAVAAAILGTSVTLFLLIRANQNPAINEGDPRTWSALWSELNREQYGQGGIFYILTHRKAPFGFQINQMFFRYVKGEYELIPEGHALHWLGWTIPLLAGLAGMVWHAWRASKSWWMMFTIALVTSLGLVIYLNFSDHEVRERDYFFTFFYQFFAVWIGMAVSALLFALDKSLSRSTAAEPALAPAGGGGTRSILPLVLAFALPFMGCLPVRSYWRTHDRSKFYIAHDYAYNMLTPLAKDAVVLTNGDNDTFPLWYLQEVESVRKDVRVANLSLLQTPWYIWQLKHVPPTVPFTFSDEEIRGLAPHYDSKGNIVWVKDMAVQDIVKANAWKRPLYMAVTVPEHEGLDNQLVLEALNYRIHPEAGPAARVDLEKTLYALDHIFIWRGILNPDGTRDTLLYKDENASRLTENYAAAYVQAAFEYRTRKQFDQALALMNKAALMSPDYPGVIGYMGIILEDAGQLGKAEEHYRAMLARHPEVPLVYQRLGYLLVRTNRAAEGERIWQQGVPYARDYKPLFQTYVYYLMEKGRPRDAINVVGQYLTYHPDDTEWSNLLATLEKMSGTTPQATAAPSTIPSLNLPRANGRQ
jgi:tetratricopeptide (TPR) repeat protein